MGGRGVWGRLSLKWFPGFLRLPDLGDEDAGEDKGAAEELTVGERFPQDDPSGKGGEDGFEAEEDRGVGRGRFSLRDDLQCEGDADGHAAGVEDGPSRGDDRSDGDIFEDEGGDEAKHGDNAELDRGEADGIGPWREQTDDEDVRSPDDGAGEHEQIAGVDVEASGNAEEMKARGGDDGADPGGGGGAVADEDAQDGDEDDVKAGDEAGVACGGVDEADLLKGRAEEEDQSGEHGAEHVSSGGGAGGIDRPGARRNRAAARRGEPYDGKEHDGAEREADAGEGHGTDMLHAPTLGDEGRAPYHGGEKQETVGQERGAGGSHAAEVGNPGEWDRVQGSRPIVGEVRGAA